MTNVVRLDPGKRETAELLIEHLEGREPNENPQQNESSATCLGTAVRMPTSSRISAVNSAALCALAATSLSRSGEHVLALLHSLDKAKNSVTETLEEIQGTFTQRPKTRLIGGVKMPLPPHVPISTASTRRLADAADSLDASIRQLVSGIIEVSAMMQQIRMMRERE